MTRVVTVMHTPVNYDEPIIDTITLDMQDEIILFFIDGMQIMAVGGKIGMMYGNYKKISDFNMCTVIIRCRV